MVISSNLGPQIGSVSYHSMHNISARSRVNYRWVPRRLRIYIYIYLFIYMYTYVELIYLNNMLTYVDICWYACYYLFLDRVYNVPLCSCYVEVYALPNKNIFAHQLRFFFVLPDQCKYRGKEQQVVKRSAWSAISSLWLVSVDLVVSWFKLSDRWVGWLQNVLIKDHGVIKFGQCLTCNITYYQGYWEVSWARCCLLEICFSTWFQALVASCHRGLPMFCPLWLQLVSMRNFSSCSWVQNGVLSGVFRLLYSVAWPYWSPISSKPLVKSMPLHPKSRNKNNLWMRSGSRPSVWSWMLWLMKMKKHQGYLEEWWVFLLKPGTKNPLFLGQKKDARKKTSRCGTRCREPRHWHIWTARRWRYHNDMVKTHQLNWVGLKYLSYDFHSTNRRFFCTSMLCSGGS